MPHPNLPRQPITLPVLFRIVFVLVTSVLTLFPEAAMATGNPAVDGVWSQATLSAYPPHRGAYNLLYDSNRHRALLLGGISATTDFGDLWALDLANPVAWELVPAFGAPTVLRGEMAAVYDPVRDRIWIWGGRNHTGAVFGEASYLQLTSVPGDTAEWHAFNPEQEPGTGNRPTPRAGQGTVYDPVGRRMMFYGGAYGSIFGTGGTWWLSLTDPPTWHLLGAPSPYPGGATYSTLTLDLGLNRLILSATMVVTGFFGVPGYWVNDVWQMPADGSGSWTMMPMSGPIPPSQDYFGPTASTFHPAGNRLLVYRRGETTYYGPTGSQPPSAIWEIPLATGEWHQLGPVNAGPLFNPRMLYDPIMNRMLAVRDTIRGNASMDTWFLSFPGASGLPGDNPATAAWTVGRADPTPFADGVQIPIGIAEVATVEGIVLDARGRRIRRLDPTALGRGTHHIAWDGRDDSGRDAPNGVYFVRLTRSHPDAVSTVRVVRTR